MSPTNVLKSFLPHLIALAVMLFVTVVYFAPAVFGNKRVGSSDITQARGMQAEMRQYRNEDGTYPLWTNGMFGGMPTYQLQYETQSLMEPANKTMLLGNVMSVPWPPIFLMMAGFYFLLLVLRTDWRLAAPISVAYGIAAGHIDLVAAGHMTKLVALAYLAPIVASALLTLRGRYLLGGALFAFFVGCQIFANHLQITFYTYLVLLILGVVHLVNAFKTEQTARVLKAAGVLLVATLLAVASNIGRLWTTYEYTAETIRGTSELTTKSANASGGANGQDGLSKNYIFQWSYGKLETFNTLVPNFMGGSSSDFFVQEADSESLRALQRLNNPEAANQLARATSHYWGNQPFTGGPVYFGAVMWLLFFVGCFLVRGPARVWLVAATVFTLMLAWGDNFKILNYFLIDYVPMFNKFRAVTMVLGITQFTVLFLGVLGLREVFNEALPLPERRRGVLLGGAVAAGLVVLALLLSFTLDFASDAERAANLPADLRNALAADRAALLRADAWRSLLFVGLGLGTLYLFIARKLSALVAVLLVGVFATVDHWGIAKRYLATDDFQEVANVEAALQPSEVDRAIQQDPDPHYRVADPARGFSYALTSLHHKAIGGYHAAKLMRFNEFINYLADPNTYRHLYDLMNVKYFITPQGPQRNPGALGNAWFVDRIEVVPTVDAEYAAIADFDPGAVALVAQPYADGLANFQPQPDSAAQIRLTSYHPDTLRYAYTANSEQFAVFSEVYYPPTKGWTVLLDGQPYDAFTKVNFIARGLKLPAGQHTVEMIFAPRSYATGETIALLASVLVLLALIAGLVLYFRTPPKNISPETLPRLERTVAGTGNLPSAKAKPTTARRAKGKRKR